MSLIITPTEQTKIIISGTSLELDSVYVRLSFIADETGRQMKIICKTYSNNQNYLEGKELHTDIVNNVFLSTLGDNDIQGVDLAHQIVKEGYELMGFNAEIVL